MFFFFFLNQDKIRTLLSKPVHPENAARMLMVYVKKKMNVLRSLHVIIGAGCNIAHNGLVRIKHITNRSDYSIKSGFLI